MYNLNEKIFYIFIDGASRSLPNEKLKRKTGRYGGKGIWLIYLDKKGNQIATDESDFRSYVSATNNDMEVGACADGLEAIINKQDLSMFRKIIVVTDSIFLNSSPKRNYLLKI